MNVVADRERWSDTEQSELVRWAEQGLTPAEIGKKLHRSKRSIIARAAHTRVTVSGCGHPAPERKPWSTQDHARLVQLVKRGYFVAEIAYELQRSYDSVCSYAARNGVTLNHSPHPRRSYERDNGPDAWREWQQQRLERLADKGLSALQIGKEVKRSRNSVISRANRTGVNLLQGFDTPEQKSAAVKPRKPKPPKPLREDLPPKVVKRRDRRARAERRPVDESKLVRLSEIPSHGCKFPIKRGADNEWLFCNQPREDDSSYCPDHTRDCYRERKRYKR